MKSKSKLLRAFFAHKLMQLDETKPFLFIGQLGRSHLIAQAVRRTFPLCTDYYDGNWIETKIEISAGRFRGTLTTTLRAEEFLQFRDELLSLNSHTMTRACLSSLEDWLKIEVERTGPGNFTAHCEAADESVEAGGGNRLRFTIAFNSTDLPAMLNSLNLIVAEFPVVGERRTTERSSVAS